MVLCNNNIDTAGATALATALHTNTTLTTLDLRVNNITAPGVTAFITALQTNTTLTTLRLDVYPHPANLLSLLQRNRALWRHQSWTYARHTDFPVACRSAILTSLLCGSACPTTRLPLQVWRLIFSFWQREIYFDQEPVYQND